MRKILLTAVEPPAAVPAFASFDVGTGTISNERWQSGVPLGGIGCGKLEIVTDGWLGYYTGNNNWDRPTGRLKGAFAAVYAEVGGKTGARMLRLDSREEYQGVKNIAGVDYCGWFPTANVTFNDAALPVSVKLEAWSPLIPHDAADLSLPVACFRFRISNPSARQGRAVLMMSWPNLVGWGGKWDVHWDD